MSSNRRPVAIGLITLMGLLAPTPALAATSESPAPEETPAPSAPATQPSEAPAETQPADNGPETEDTETEGSETAGSESPNPDEETAENPDGETTVSLLNINDFHGRMSEDIAMPFAKLITDQQAVNPGNTLFLSSGDDIGASLYVSSVQDDNPTLDYLNALGLDASALGNHEFDKGVSDLVDRVFPRSDFDHLAANVIVKETGEPLTDPYKIYETESGHSVAVVGGVTQETVTLVNPAGIESVEFKDPVESVNTYIEQLSDGDASNGEADIIVASYHEGVNTDNIDNDRIVNNTHPEADVIFTGHTHELYNVDAPVPGEEGKTRPVMQTGEYGSNLARVDFNVDAEGEIIDVEHKNLPAEQDPSDEEIAASPVLTEVKQIVDDAAAVAEEEGSVVIGDLEDYITTGYNPEATDKGGFDQRDRESTMGHLVADAWLWAGNNNPAGLSADIGVLAAGSLRDEFPSGLRLNKDLQPGEVTVADAVSVNPFANDIYVVEITGEQLREALEQQWQTTADGEIPSRPYLQLALSSNVRYTFTGEVSTNANNRAGHETLGNNIDQIWVNDKLVTGDETFKVALPSFLAAGGDNFRAFGNSLNQQQTALIDSDIFVNYLRDELDGKIAPRFDQQAINISDVSDSYDINGELTFGLQSLGVPSYNAPIPENFAASIVTEDGTEVELGTVEVQDKAGNVTFDLSQFDLAAGNVQVKLVDETTGTIITRAIELTGERDDEGGQPGDGETTEPGDEETSEQPGQPGDDETSEQPGQPGDDETSEQPGQQPGDEDESGKPSEGGEASEDGEAGDKGQGGAEGSEQGSEGSQQGSLASTGATIGGLALLGVAALGVGALLVRRRANAHE
ncbi:5'-nucleotidase C-terminal domain-containing protein [Auritidibacter ignavus]|uniref:5'-nucleotidase C-terminal domain-containing protein n=1 Tax=Auritidibacter ignavus TaxID=678932 RepID=UPI00244D2DA2|nr:5'-nucleotidase C-terminal domain-containing protein [Auritidibacter ignavus]WGH84800.1 5'-nucleotidase C-terminal domain-containing protein [Auritidibacter ignavus]